MTALVTDPEVVGTGDVAGPAGPRRRRPSPMAWLAPAATSPWVGRAVFMAFAVAMWFLPELLGDPTRVRQFAEYLTYAMVAVGIDVAWGYGGMLVLGQGLFFGLGAYAMGMHLSLEQVGPGQMPQFMALYSDHTELPWLWKPFESLPFAIAASVVVPVVVATLLGLLVFRNRVRGPYFAILTQALALVFTLVLVDQLPLTAGTNGLTNFSTIFGRSKYDPATNEFLYALALGGLLLVVAVGWMFVHSRLGRLLVAVRDGEDRVRFLGYDPAVVKTVAFAVGAGMAGLAGALAAPIIGIVAPNQFAIVPSILMVCWVAVGGRGAIWGAVVGALLVSWGKTNFSEARPDDWVYIQGLLFVVVVGFVPGGIVGVVRSAGSRITGLLAGRTSPSSAPVADAPDIAIATAPDPKRTTP